jgi:hypothetical protein
VHNLTADGNRLNDGLPIGSDCSFHGFEIIGSAVTISFVAVKNMACGGVLPRTGSTGFQLTDSQAIDCHFGLWAEATCGNAAHLIARNRFVTTQPGVMDAFDYDNGNDDGASQLHAAVNSRTAAPDAKPGNRKYVLQAWYCCGTNGRITHSGQLCDFP